MRRLTLSLIASCGIALLTACSGQGGYGFNGFGGTGNGSATGGDAVQFTNGSGQILGTFFLAPNPNAPAAIYAQSYHKNTGVVAQDVSFSWGATIVGNPPGGTTWMYESNNAGVLKPCPALPPAATIPGTPPGIQIFVQNSSGSFTPPLVPLAPGAFSKSVYILPVPGVPAPYCINIVATPTTGNIGSVLVVVSNSP